MNYFSKNLFLLRKKFGVTQSQIGKVVDKRPTTIGNWENGVSYPDLDDLLHLIQFFGVTFEALTQQDFSKLELTADASKEGKPGYQVIQLSAKGKAKRSLARYEDNRERGSMVNDSGDMKEWVSIQLLRGIDKKLDELIETTKKRK
jgi:transcriptional regulator with XRE-family HTH domain